jgi:hypothetical protein
VGDDKDKSIIERTIETAKEIATSISDVAERVMEPEPPKDGDEVVMMSPMPMADMGMLGTSAAICNHSRPQEIAKEGV